MDSMLMATIDDITSAVKKMESSTNNILIQQKELLSEQNNIIEKQMDLIKAQSKENDKAIKLNRGMFTIACISLLVSVVTIIFSLTF